MSTFADACLGDRIELRNLPQLLVRDDWGGPLLLLSPPVPCDMPGCGALRCEALASDGRWVPLHRLGWRPIDIVEHGPVSEPATPSGDVLAENAKPAWDPWTRSEDPDAFADRAHDDTPNDEGDNEQ